MYIAKERELSSWGKQLHEIFRTCGGPRTQSLIWTIHFVGIFVFLFNPRPPPSFLNDSPHNDIDMVVRIINRSLVKLRESSTPLFPIDPMMVVLSVPRRGGAPAPRHFP